MEGLQIEALFVQTVLQLAEKYGVTAEIDYENNNVNFVGDCDDVALAQELEEVFGRYADE